MNKERKRALVVLQFCHFSEFLERYKRCSSQNDNDIAGRFIVMTENESIPCSIASVRKSHQNWPQLKELYEKRLASRSSNNQHVDLELLNQQIVKLHRQIDDDILHQAQILIKFDASVLREKYRDRFNPDVQIIDDMEVFNRSHYCAVISQVLITRLAL